MKEETNSIGSNSIYVTSVTPDNHSKKPPLVFIHMSWGGSWAFKMYTQYFATKGWNCYAPDLRGHGKSGGKVAGATMKDYVADVNEVVNFFKLKNPFIIGHSMGGLIALMYASEYKIKGVVSIDGSPTLEIQGEGRNITYPPEYTPMDAGMPTDPEVIMKAFSDLTAEQLMNMKKMLKTESGVARSERKRGISISKESITVPRLFVGAERGASVPFGIGIEKSKKMAAYYGADIIEIKGASHPGILMGAHWNDSAEKINEWLSAHV